MASATATAIPKTESGQNYKGFVAGVFSGVAKLTGESRNIYDNRLWLIFDDSRPSIRHDQGPPPDFQQEPILGSSRMPPPNSPQRRRPWSLQGRNSSPRGLDVW